MAEKKIVVDQLKVGQEYYRSYLAELWNYDGTKGLEKGIVPAKDNIIVLFTTEDKDKHSTQYEDKYADGILTIDGQNAHRTDAAVLDPKTKFYSFYRKTKKIKADSVPFTYQGEAELIREKCIIRQKGESPSKFCFRILADCSNDEIGEEIDKALENEIGNMSEGAQKYVRHITYERNPKIRQEALKCHLHHCEVCGFDFDKFYGSDFAEGYIEIHHVKPISEAGVREVNPATDLVPVCANCHRMLHHKRSLALTVEELKKRIADSQSKRHKNGNNHKP